MLLSFLIAPLTFLICLLFIVQEIDGAHSSNGDSGRHISQKEKRMDIDLNKPYIEGNSSENDSFTSAANPGNTLPSNITSEVQKKPYIYRPRKPIDSLSQSRSAVASRKKLASLRQEGKIDELNEILEKQKKRMKPIVEKHKLETQTYGHSSRPRDIRSRQLREKVRLGTATKEESDYIATQKLKAKPSEKRKSETMKALRQKVHSGTATLEEINRVQRRRASNRAYYHRSKN